MTAHRFRVPFRFAPLAPFSEIITIIPSEFSDDRGWFAETYKESEFRANGISLPFVQDNHTFSKRKGTIRGLHYQTTPYTQGKLVRCTQGAVFDAVVDLRLESPTFGKWASVELSPTNRTMIWVPPGFAHGIATLADHTEVQYKVTAEYSAHHERSLRWDDPDLAIPWPVSKPILSAKDRDAPRLDATQPLPRSY